MRYDDDSYEDELDRMRARRQRKKTGHETGYSTRNPAGENGARRSDGTDDDFEEFDIEEGRVDEQDSYKNDRNFSGDDEDAYDYRDKERIRFAEQRTATQGRRRNVAAAPQGGKKRRKRRGFLKVLLLAAVLVAGYLLFQWVRDDSYWTIAVFGVDSRDGNVGKGALSDVEMLCSINKKTGEIRLVSVFRDSYLRIDQKDDYDKINEAYFKGGQKQATDALRDNLGLQIDDYATFNWKAVVDAINVLGGVDIEITDKEFAYINSFITETVNSTGVGSVQLQQAGMNHLDGVQAVAYARLRLMDTDFNRTERQRKVLGQAMEKAKNADFKTLKTLVGAVYPQISTSIGVDNLIGMAKSADKYYIGQTSGFPFSHQEMKIGKKSCVVPTTLESNVIQLYSFLYDNAQYVPSENIKSISAHIADVSGLGAPGKDVESGKNIGTEGNSGGGQGGKQTQAPAETPETTPPETESASEETSEPESSTEESSEPETVEPLKPDEEETSTSGVIEQPSTENGSSHQTGPGANSGNNGGNQPASGGTSEAPGGPAEVPKQTTGSLEGPGQNSGSDNSPEEQGPGV